VNAALQWLADLIANIFLGWLKDRRAEEALKDLGANQARNDGVKEAEREEQIARDAGRDAYRVDDSQLRVDDGFRRD